MMVTLNTNANGKIAILRLRESPCNHGELEVEMISFLIRRIRRMMMAIRLNEANMLTVLMVEMVAVVTVEDIPHTFD